MWAMQKTYDYIRWAAGPRVQFWQTGCRREAPPRCCCVKRERTRRTGGYQSRYWTAARATRHAIRASCGPTFASPPRPFPTTTPTPQSRASCDTSRHGCWAGGRRSTGNWRTAGRRAITTSGSSAARVDGGGKRSCPYFKKLERDIDFEGLLHGADGPIPVRRVFPNNWSDYAKAVAEAFKQAGYRTCRTRTASSRTATTPLPCRTFMTGASQPLPDISVPPSVSART